MHQIIFYLFLLVIICLFRLLIINLGGNKPYKLIYMIRLIEKYLDKKARIKYLPFNKSDIKSTWADISKAGRLLNWKPQVSLAEGMKKTIDWYLENKKWAAKIALID